MPELPIIETFGIGVANVLAVSYLLHLFPNIVCISNRLLDKFYRTKLIEILSNNLVYLREEMFDNDTILGIIQTMLKLINEKLKRSITDTNFS